MPDRLSGLLREWRLAEVRLLFLALVVAVLSVSSVSFFTDRVERAMRLQGTALLGADLLVSSSRPIGENVRKLTRDFSSEDVVQFRSVLLAGDNSLLTEVKAVGETYPLRGAVETTVTLGEKGSAASGTPAPGEAWAAAEVFYRLGLEPGDSVQLGESEFTLTRVISFEMDAGGSVFRMAPRLMIHLQSLPGTGLITAASRANYSHLIAGPEMAIASLQPRLKAVLAPQETLQTVEEGRPEITGALQRAVRFMKLASVLTVILAGAAVALAVLSYAHREARNIAVLKTLGATRAQLSRNYFERFSVLILGAGLVGSLLGFTAQFFLARILSDWLNITLPPATATPLLAGLVTASLTLLGFALPPIVQVLQTPPMRIIRAEAGGTAPHALFSVLSIGLAISLFLIWQAGEFKLAALVFVSILAAMTLMQGIAWLTTRLFHRIRLQRGPGWQLGLANIGRYGGRASLLISTIGIGILALSLLGSVRLDLISAWQQRVPDDAPNHFLINIQPPHLEAVEGFLQQRDLPDYMLYPMTRGRLVTINGKRVTASDYENNQAQETLRRELNLTSSSELPKANEIISGNWFKIARADQNDKPQGGLSVESEIADRLGVALGDSMGFDIGGRIFEAPVTSLRTVQWDTMQPNFYVIAAPGSLQGYPMNYITSVRIDPEDTHFTTDLVRAFPEITVLDVRAILAQVRRIIAQASSAVEAVFSFSLLAGIVVLLAALQTQRNERRQEIAILKTLGASTQQIRSSVATEFMVLGMLAGLLGATMAQITGWVLAEQLFNLDYTIAWSAILWGTFAGIVGLGGVGYAVIQRLVRTPPMHLLQEI